MNTHFLFAIILATYILFSCPGSLARSSNRVRVRVNRPYINRYNRYTVVHTYNRPYYNSYRRPYSGDAFRTSNYNVPQLIVANKGGVGPSMRNALLLSGAVYIAVSLRPKIYLGDGTVDGRLAARYAVCEVWDLNSTSTTDEVSISASTVSPTTAGNDTTFSPGDYGYLLCPSDLANGTLSSDERYCCGPPGIQECCDIQDFYAYHDTNVSPISNKTAIAVLVVCIILGLGCCIGGCTLVYCCCLKKRLQPPPQTVPPPQPAAAPMVAYQAVPGTDNGAAASYYPPQQQQQQYPMAPAPDCPTAGRLYPVVDQGGQQSQQQQQPPSYPTA